MLNIGFINPSSDYLKDPFRGDPHTQLYILTELEEHFGNKINPLLIDLRGIKREFAIQHIPECDLYLHSVYTLDYNEQKSLVKGLREYYPKAKHIAGGPHVVEFPEESAKIFDSLIIGEGEESIIDVLNDLQNSDLKKVYEQKSKIDISLYPFSRRKYLPKSATAKKGLMTLKSKKGYEELLGTTTLFSRGCPFNCAFCAMPNLKQFDKGTRYNSPGKIKDEIEYLKKEYDIQGINMLDEIGIPFSKEKAISYLEAIASTGIVWRAQTRVDGITPEIAKMAKDAGCIALGLGIESVSQTALDMINKKIQVEDARRTLKILKENGIETRAYMILGLPGEPRDIVKQTWDFIEETQPDLVYLSLFTVRPGTEVYSNPKKFGIKNVNTDWDKTMHLFGRYDNEIPTLTFEYENETPWGKGFTQRELVNNYIEIQTKLRERGLSHI
ncbi:MAG: radical SAM protein [Candidatus Pacearchaeota archaeon]|nr:radical SAM protein [Candidatus Pacearchaeota archaeon]